MSAPDIKLDITTEEHQRRRIIRYGAPLRELEVEIWTMRGEARIIKGGVIEIEVGTETTVTEIGGGIRTEGTEKRNTDLDIRVATPDNTLFASYLAFETYSARDDETEAGESLDRRRSNEFEIDGQAT